VHGIFSYQKLTKRTISHLIPSHQESPAVFASILKTAFPGWEEEEREDDND
jgi:hypothetical protein